MVLLTVALAITPGVPLWIFAVLASWVLVWVLADLVAKRGGRAELWAVGAMGNSILSVAVVVAGTGGPASPFRYWMILPVAGLMTRYSRRAVALGLFLAFCSLIAAMVLVDPDGVVSEFSLVTTPLALLAATAMMCWALMKSETSQRADAIVDQLTGLLNRKALVSRASAATYHATLTDAPISLIMCDLDHFKQVNDVHGHAVGDAVLRDAAYAIRTSLRSFDDAFRIGGEEFVLLLPDVDSASASDVAERIRHAVEQARPAGIAVTVSIGMATLTGEHATLEQLLAQGDAALYASKDGGRNRVTVAQPEGLQVDVEPPSQPQRRRS